MVTNKQDQSFGVIPLRKGIQGWEVFLVCHRRGSYWGFPKGHAEGHETPQEAAQRELTEETHLTVVRFLSLPSILERYAFFAAPNKIDKRVQYFLAEVQGEPALQEKEIVDGAWIPLALAKEKCTYESTRSVCEEIKKALLTETFI